MSRGLRSYAQPRGPCHRGAHQVLVIAAIAHRRYSARRRRASRAGEEGESDAMIPTTGCHGLRRRIISGAAFCAVLLSVPLIAQAQDFPQRPVRLIVPSPPGGGTDIIARNVAQKFTERWRFAAVVENKTGAGSLVGTDYVAKAPPDGHTLLIGGLFNMVMNSALIKDLSYDPVRDFVPVGYISAYPFLLTVRPDMPVSNLATFVAYARERPGKLNYGSAGPRSPTPSTTPFSWPASTARVGGS